jgi:predicted alpha/beta-fold hydrolase
VFQPWGFRLRDISIPVSIWHGSQDPWVKQEDIDFQMSTIPKCSLVIWPDIGHLGFVKHLTYILEAVV